MSWSNRQYFLVFESFGFECRTENPALWPRNFHVLKVLQENIGADFEISPLPIQHEFFFQLFIIQLFVTCYAV
jgi:hypothetical protein